jgi:hypothetical protein
MIHLTQFGNVRFFVSLKDGRSVLRRQKGITMAEQLCKRVEALFRILALVLVVFSAANSAAGTERMSQAPSSSTNDRSQSDLQVKAVVDRMAAAGVLHPVTVEEVRKAYLFYATLSGKPEQVFRVEDRTIPGPAGQILIRVYTPNSSSALPIFVFFTAAASWRETLTPWIRLFAA